MKHTFFLLSAALLLASCNNSQDPGTKPADTPAILTDADTVPLTVKDIVRFKFDFAMGNVPSPAEVVSDMSTYRLVYNSEWLNDPSKAKSYTTEFSKAINLGVYNLDMAYAIANAQGSDVIKYLKTSLIEIDQLGMKAAFDQFIGKRTETNINNRDSLMRIIDEMYVKGDSYLRTNQRVETATYIFMGSWIEALQLICRTGESEADALQKARIRKLLWEQRFYLKNFVELLAEFDNPDAIALKNELAAIRSEIEAIPEVKDLKAKNFNSLAAKIYALRERLVKA